MTLTILLMLITVAFTSNASAKTDLSLEFKKIYDQKLDLTSDEQSFLKQFDIYFIPGVLAESLIGSDTGSESKINISKFTKDYFGTQLEFLNNKYKIPAKRIKTSSYNVLITRENIREAVTTARNNNRKVILLSHSLGGLALIEELIENPEIQNDIGGIVFLQSPFYGAPFAEVLKSLPYTVEKAIRTTLPFVNISDETVHFVSYENRIKFMVKNFLSIRKLIKKVPIYTFAGIADGKKSLFGPIIDVMESGCIKGLNDKCITKKFYPGPYDKSDGLIPLKSSHLDNADFVVLEDADHGEIILKVPYTDYSKEHLTTTWLRVLMQKMH